MPFGIGFFAAGAGGLEVTGGTIVISGGFKYHTFTSSGTLVVKGGILTGAEILMIAGGASAPFFTTTTGAGRYMGGAGAGEIRLRSAVTLAAGSYSVGIGSSDSSTTFTGQTTVVTGSQPVAGGTRVGAASGNGFAGGAYDATWDAAGGGGGAGQAGQSGTGGNGLNTYSTWATATTTGVGGWYGGGGGGGGGGADPGAGRPGGAGGGGKGSTNLSTNFTDGTANTGSGGGGRFISHSGSGAGGVGGSGLLIVRYAV